MHDPTKLSSKELLHHLLADLKTGDFNDQKIYEMEREIEQQMEKFDMRQREKSAQVMNDLSKDYHHRVITSHHIKKRRVPLFLYPVYPGVANKKMTFAPCLSIDGRIQ